MGGCRLSAVEDKIPYNDKKLKDWAGWRAFRDGRALFERGVVEKVTYEHPFVTGTLSLGPRGMRSKFEILKNGLVENHCPCRDNQERGLICSHLVAMGLEVLRQHNKPSRNDASMTAKQRIERIASGPDKRFVKRAEKSDGNAVKAGLVIELSEDWRAQVAADRITLHLSVEYDGTRRPLSDVPSDMPFSFSRADEKILTALEHIGAGASLNDVQLSLPRVIRILKELTAKSIHERGRKKACSVNGGMLDTHLVMDLDRVTGELILNVETQFPGDEQGRDTLYIIADNTGWVFCDGQFWPLNTILPAKYRDVYQGEVRIPRESVPAFIMTELPKIEKTMVVQTSITPDLFQMKPAKVYFRLVVKGSPASLAATLYARYTDEIELVAGRADMRGNFAIPDPKDLLRYRIRNMAYEKAGVEKLDTVGPARCLTFLEAACPCCVAWAMKWSLKGGSGRLPKKRIMSGRSSGSMKPTPADISTSTTNMISVPAVFPSGIYNRPWPRETPSSSGADGPFCSMVMQSSRRWRYSKSAVPLKGIKRDRFGSTAYTAVMSSPPSPPWKAWMWPPNRIGWSGPGSPMTRSRWNPSSSAGTLKGRSGPISTRA
jgi:hypothetical protein